MGDAFAGVTGKFVDPDTARCYKRGSRARGVWPVIQASGGTSIFRRGQIGTPKFCLNGGSVIGIPAIRRHNSRCDP
jgi:hypothetical protein